MREPSTISPLPWRRSPLEIVASWPANRPLLMLYSGRTHPRWSRWSVLATPAARYQFDGISKWVGSAPLPVPLRDVVFTDDPLIDLQSILNATRTATSSHKVNLPFHGGWIGCISYDLGRCIESQACCRGAAVDDRHWPLIDLCWCPDALIVEHESHTWHAVGENLLHDLAGRAQRASELEFELGRLRPHVSREQYLSMVQQAVDYIAAGDIFQANIAQRFTASFAGSTRGLAQSLFQSAQPWYGAYLEFAAPPAAHSSQHSKFDRHDNRESRCVISLSPELFLQFDPASRRVTTRPIKGTRPGADDPQQLQDSAKDAAELHMIIDLMRNDLGRVCEFGSVEVAQARCIERHPTVHHGVGEVTGILRSGASFADLLQATFPGGSVTGAPKIRAMQIIDELEPVKRGPYCGAIGCISDCGFVNLNIAIRTALLSGEGEPERCDQLRGILDYSAGAGIVADSKPMAEFNETLDKMAVIRPLAEQPPMPHATLA